MGGFAACLASAIIDTFRIEGKGVEDPGVMYFVFLLK